MLQSCSNIGDQAEPDRMTLQQKYPEQTCASHAIAIFSIDPRFSDGILRRWWLPWVCRINYGTLISPKQSSPPIALWFELNRLSVGRGRWSHGAVMVCFLRFKTSTASVARGGRDDNNYHPHNNENKYNSKNNITFAFSHDGDGCNSFTRQVEALTSALVQWWRHRVCGSIKANKIRSGRLSVWWLSSFLVGIDEWIKV